MFRNTSNKLRRAIAAVEFAIVLPPLVLMILGTIEASCAINAQHALQEASMTGCRIYTLREKTQLDATNMIDQTLTAAGLSGHSITYNPATDAEVDVHMEPVTVSISVPYSSISWGASWFMTSSTITASSTLPADLKSFIVVP